MVVRGVAVASYALQHRVEARPQHIGSTVELLAWLAELLVLCYPAWAEAVAAGFGSADLLPGGEVSISVTGMVQEGPALMFAGLYHVDVSAPFIPGSHHPHVSDVCAGHDVYPAAGLVLRLC